MPSSLNREKTVRVISFLIKLIVTIIIFGIIARMVDMSAALQALTSARPDLLAAGIGLQFMSTLVVTVRWKLMMRALAYEQKWTFFFKSYLRAVFFNQALPTNVGGDVVRAFDLSQAGYPKKEAIYSVLIDRGIGVFGLLLLNLVAIFFGADHFPDQLIRSLAAVVLILMAGAFILFFARDITFLGRIRVLKYGQEISSRVRTIFSSWTISIQLLLLCVLVHLFSISAICLLGKSIGMTYNFIVYLVLVPPVFLLLLLPVSLAGWGIREGGMVTFFLFVNADKSSALVVSLLYGIALMVTALPGAYFYLTGTRKNNYRSQLADPAPDLKQTLK